MDLFTVLVLLLIIALGFAFDAERDTVAFRPRESWFPDSIFWTRKLWQNVGWFRKTFLAMTLDGWHFCKFMYHSCLFFVIAIMANIMWNDANWIAGWIGLHLLYGAVFESNYGNHYL